MARTTTGIAITGHGVWHPPSVLTNDELVAGFNEFVRRDNATHQPEITAGVREALKESTSEFIYRASGIEQRYVKDKTGLVDPERMCPNIPERTEDQLSYQAEYAKHAAMIALAKAGAQARTSISSCLALRTCSACIRRSRSRSRIRSARRRATPSTSRLAAPPRPAQRSWRTRRSRPVPRSARSSSSPSSRPVT